MVYSNILIKRLCILYLPWDQTFHHMVYRPNKNCETDLLFCEVDTGRAMNLLLDYFLYFLSDLSNGFIINTKTGTN